MGRNLQSKRSSASLTWLIRICARNNDQSSLGPRSRSSFRRSSHSFGSSFFFLSPRSSLGRGKKRSRRTGCLNVATVSLNRHTTAPFLVVSCAINRYSVAVPDGFPSIHPASLVALNLDLYCCGWITSSRATEGRVPGPYCCPKTYCNSSADGD